MHQPTPLEAFTELIGRPDEEIDLGRAGFVIAATRYPEVDVEEGVRRLDALARGGEPLFGDRDDPLFCANTLSQYLFDEIGFRGNRDEYYDPDNSCLNRVLERRLGIPITLSLLYIEVGRRLGIPLVGVGMPGHFLVRHRDIEDLFIDPFYGGILLSVAECVGRLRQIAGADTPWDPGYLAPVGKREFIARMLRNLKAIHLHRQDYEPALGISELLVALLPDSGDERRDRGLVRHRLGRHREALQDIQAYIATAPPGADLIAVRDLMDRLVRLIDES